MRYPEQFDGLQIRTYLNKLSLPAEQQPDLESLNRLLLAQLTRIPFDSLDVWGAGICPSLALEDLYRKIILGTRGGYCFELNTLFRALLNGLGFDACQVMACILTPEGVPQPPTHNVILCRLQGTCYFLDVGFGGPVPYRALELRPGLQEGFLLENREGLWYVFRVTEEETRPVICFREVPVSVNALIPLNFYISQRPDSHFRHMIHLNRRDPDGSIYSLNGKEFKIHTDRGVSLREVNTIEEVKEIMLTYYGIDPAAAPLRDTL